jgi:lipopolysaccharide biosynthesis glycosyltransferase
VIDDMHDNGKNTAVTFVTDNGFLIPSIVAALQVLEQPAVSKVADVFIFTVDIGQETVDEVSRIFSIKGINFIPIPSESFVPSTEFYFTKNHVPKTALGRFAIQKFLPAQYQNIVYFDGDIQIVGDIEPLVNFRVPPGHLAAAPEFVWLTEGDIGDFWRKHKAYLGKLGIENPKEYFNSGVMAADRSTWTDKSQEALGFFEKHSDLCLYHDQSALNAVCRGSVIYISPIYNYSSFYANLNINEEMNPKIIHFTGGGKPWNYVGPPWNGKFYGIYKAFIEANPTLSKYLDLSVRVQGQTGSVLVRGKESLLRSLRLARRQRAMRAFMAGDRFATR